MIIRILESGGSKSPEEILREAKIDICTVEFWRDSFETIKEWERELLKL